MNNKQAFIDLEKRFQIVSNTLFYLIENNRNILKYPSGQDIKELSEKAQKFAEDKYSAVEN